LRGLGYSIVVVTNQGGVARGTFTEKQVHRVHERINKLVRESCGVQIDRFYYCPYHPEARLEEYRREHEWRKPQPGMILQAAEDLELDLSRSWTIGDQTRDVEAGLAAGTRTILIDTEGAEKDSDTQQHSGQPEKSDEQVAVAGAPHFVAADLIEAVKIVARHRSGELQSEPAVRPHESDDRDPAAPDTAAKLLDTSGNTPDDVAAPPEHPHDPNHAPPPRSERPATIDAQAEPRASAAIADAGAPENGRAAADELPESSKHLLRQILQELRREHHRAQELSTVKMLCIVLQATAFLCLLAAFWMSGSDEAMFVRWLGSALLIQLATIAMLLFQGGR